MDKVAFDMDGVLINTFPDFYNSLELTFSKLNIPLPTRETVKKLLGTAKEDFNAKIGIPKMKEKEFSEMKFNYLEPLPVRLVPGVFDALEKLAHKKSLPFYLVTADPTKKNKIFIERHPIHKFFLLNGKPTYHHVSWPEPKTKVLEDLGIKIFVTDSTEDVLHGIHASTDIHVIAVANEFSYCLREDHETIQQQYPDKVTVVDTIDQVADKIIQLQAAAHQ